MQCQPYLILTPLPLVTCLLLDHFLSLFWLQLHHHDSRIRVATYNCRGWKSGVAFVVSLLINCDICLVQEHWLLEDHLSALDISSEFCSFGVSGMISSDLIVGRPFGGCGILYRKSLSPIITRFKPISTRLCAISITSDCFTTILICVYLPTNYGNSNDYFMETIGELERFIDSHNFDNIVIAGDFNVDFARSSPFRECLCSFMSDLNLSAVDVLPQYSIQFT